MQIYTIVNLKKWHRFEKSYFAKLKQNMIFYYKIKDIIKILIVLI